MSDSERFVVPVVDISPCVEAGTASARASACAAFDHAASTVGFMQIVGHGVPASVTEGLKGAIDDFFGMDRHAKLEYVIDGANRGYTPPKSESLALSAGIVRPGMMNDFFEAYNVGVEARSFTGLDLDEADYGINIWPRLEGWREAIEAYFAHARRVADALTAIFTDALGLEAGYMSGITDHSIDVLRLNNYALPVGTISPTDELVGMSEHTDFGIVTVLWADQVAGLQVLDTAGAWHDVSPVDDALLVNLGDLTASLTNDTWMSTLHRVMPPVIDGQVQRRRSAAFFHDGNADALIETLPRFIGEDGIAYPTRTVSEHVKRKLAGSRQGKVNTLAEREAARVRAAGG